MKTILITLLIALTSISGYANENDFLFKLKLKNSHLGEIFFGCTAGATDKYDRKKDGMAPPPGIQTGYTAFQIPKYPPLYKDIRGFSDQITWKLASKVYTKKPVIISWDKTSVPKGYILTISQGDKIIDMAETSELKLEKSTVILIDMIKETPEKNTIRKAPGKKESQK